MSTSGKKKKKGPVKNLKTTPSTKNVEAASATKNTRAVPPTKSTGAFSPSTRKYWILAGILTVAVIAVWVVIAMTLSGKEPVKGNSTASSKTSSASVQTASKTGTDFDAKKDVVVIEMENGGLIKIELYPDQAPLTVQNFVNLVNQGFYNGLKFHRVVKGFMIQGGDPKGNGTGGASSNIKGEFTQNGVTNSISHIRGVISMARGSSMNSASSQFFIMHADTTSLDGSYAAFGKVIGGMDVVDAIANVKCDRTDPQSPAPIVPQVMKQVRIETR